MLAAQEVLPDPVAIWIRALVRHAQAKRILFLVDRGNLGRQTLLGRFARSDNSRLRIASRRARRLPPPWLT